MTTGAKLFFGSVFLGGLYAYSRMPSIKLLSEGNNTMRVRFSINGVTKEIEFSMAGGLQSFADANGYLFIANPMPDENGMSFHIGIDFNPEDGSYKIAESKFFEFIEVGIAGKKEKTFYLKTIRIPRLRLVNATSESSLKRAVKNENDKIVLVGIQDRMQAYGSWVVEKNDKGSEWIVPL